MELLFDAAEPRCTSLGLRGSFKRSYKCATHSDPLDRRFDSPVELRVLNELAWICEPGISRSFGIAMACGSTPARSSRTREPNH